MRLLQPESAGETAPTETAAGRAAGTLPYMSPEQLRGRGVDARSDLYAVGAVLFELATGRRVFEQANEVELADAILHEPPPSPRSLKSTLSPGLEAIVLKALDKDPELRYQAAREMLVDLERLQVGSSAGSGSGDVLIPGTRRRNRRPAVWVASAGAVVILALAAWWLWPPAPPRVLNVRAVTSGLAPDSWELKAHSWATDGTRLYYTDGRERRAALFQVSLHGGDALEIPLPFTHEIRIYGYVRRESALLMTGAERALISTDEPGVPLWLVPVPTGGPRRIGGLQVTDVALSPDESRLAASGEVSCSCATSRRQSASPSPQQAGGRRDSPGPPTESASASTPSRPTGPPGSGRPRWREGPPGRGGGAPAGISRAGGPGPSWTADGRYFLFTRWSEATRRMELFAARDRGRLPWRESEPVQVTFGPARLDYGVVPAPDGTTLLAYGEVPKGELVRLSSGRERLEALLRGVSATAADISADGKWIAWVDHPGNTLWRSRLDGSERLQLTEAPLAALRPRWSPDGAFIAFSAIHFPNPDAGIYVVPSRGGEPERLSPTEAMSTTGTPAGSPTGRQSSSATVP